MLKHIFICIFEQENILTVFSFHLILFFRFFIIKRVQLYVEPFFCFYVNFNISLTLLFKMPLYICRVIKNKYYESIRKNNKIF